MAVTWKVATRRILRERKYECQSPEAAKIPGYNPGTKTKLRRL